MLGFCKLEYYGQRSQTFWFGGWGSMVEVGKHDPETSPEVKIRDSLQGGKAVLY